PPSSRTDRRLDSSLSPDPRECKSHRFLGSSKECWDSAERALGSQDVKAVHELLRELGRKERRAHSRQAVRVVDADPENHRDLLCSAKAKIRAPANVQIASTVSFEKSMSIRTFELSSVDGRRFVKVTDRWVNLRVDHNSTVTLISELGDRQASVDFRFTANYHASE